MNALKTSRAQLALGLLLILAGATPAGAVTTKHHHRAATHHVAARAGKAGRTHTAKTTSRHHAVGGHTRHHAKTAVAQSGPPRRHAALCRTVTVRHHEVEKCR